MVQNVLMPFLNTWSLHAPLKVGGEGRGGEGREGRGGEGRGREGGVREGMGGEGGP